MKLLLTITLLPLVNLYAQKTKLKIGDKIPSIILLDQFGNEFNSNHYLEKKAIVLFFYPKDNGKECTKQVCSFRDNYSKFKKLNAKVVGINPGYLVYHTDFSENNKLQYPLLVDKNNRIQKIFGVPNVGFSSLPKRYTFIIDKYGIIKHIYYNSKDAKSHIEESLKALNK